MMRACLFALGLVCLAAGAYAAPPAVPAALDPWRDWVLHDADHLACPFMANSGHGGPNVHPCAWSGTLRFETTPDGAVFSQDWRLYADGWVTLPGNTEVYPVEVRVGNARPPVVLRGGRPQVWLEVGVHRLGGIFRWERRPANIGVAPQTGLVELTTDGTVVPFPRLADATLWLGGQTDAAPAIAESLRLTVHRRAADGVPITITTRINVEVSGAAREVTLGRAVPEGFAPMVLDSALPARIEQDGMLRAQVRPGTWQIDVVARATTAQPVLAAAPASGDWPTHEIWSWSGDDRLRVTHISGGEPVDPQRVDVPPEWQQLPAFRLANDARLTIDERSRGLSADLQNRLTLERQLWLDFDGEALTAVDAIRGRMETGWRLDMAAPYQLGSATLGGDNLLVTRGSDGAAGVEIRPVDIALTATSRVAASSGVMPVTGWRQDFSGVRTVLYLPPAHRLVAAPGVDTAHGAWLGRWELLDYFLVLLIAVALGRLAGPVTGAATFVALVLCWHERGAPTWIWLLLAAGMALATHAPAGRLKTVSRGFRHAAFVLLLIVAVPFAASQLRLAIYEQLETPGAFAAAAVRGAPAATVDHVRAEEPPLAADEAGQASKLGRAREAYEAAIVTRSRMQPTQLERYAPGALVQAGPGIPRWQRNAVHLSWNGPVTASQTMRLIVVEPIVLRILRIVVVALLAFVIFRIVRQEYRDLRLPGRGSPTAWLLAAVLVAGHLPDDARAQSTPDPALLGELRQRLLEPPDCVPTCAGIALAELAVDPATLSMTLDISALETVAVPLPGADSGWLPQQVDIDGRRAGFLHRDDAGTLHLVLGEGRHRVALSGPMPPVDTVRLPFPLPPRNVSLDVKGWEVAGVVGGRLVSGALELVRVRAADAVADGATVLEAERMPPFVRVIRTLHFDVDWWVETEVERLAPRQGGFTVSVPLLDGERPLDQALEIIDDVAKVGLAAGQDRRSWTSTLGTRPSLVLEAPDSLDYAPVWRLAPGPAWHVDHAGVPLVRSSGPFATWHPEFVPLPGERLELTLTQPEATTGTTLVFDAVSLAVEQGKRGTEVNLVLDYRSTRGGNHDIVLPGGVRVVEVNIDGEPQSVRPTGDTLSLPILPGEHDVTVRFTSETPIAVRSVTPGLALGAAATNVSTRLRLPRDRWVLLASGPDVGPAVLLWSELAAFIAIALVLGRVGLTPLRTHHWLLLGLGFSTFSWGILVLLATWLFAFAWRERRPAPVADWQFNAAQVALAALTVVTLIALVVAVPLALLGYPDMHVAGNGSSATSLAWFTDRIEGAMPVGSAWTVPLYIYKAAILLWALWLAFALLRWLRWVWQAWSDGGIWRGRVVTEPAGSGSGADKEPA